VPKVADCMMRYKKETEDWKKNQIETFTQLASEYLTVKS
jgi:hypothetical protein